MRKIICYYSEVNNAIVTNEEPGAMMMYPGPDEFKHFEYLDEVKGVDLGATQLPPGPIVQIPSPIEGVLALAKGGMSAEDITKLKHAGVI